MKNIMVIINPSAGKENHDKILDRLKAKLSEEFDYIDVRTADLENDAFNFAKEAAQKSYEAICSVGGDGTYKEILRGLKDLEYKPKILLIPAGTGNILSRYLGFPQNVSKAISSVDFSKTIKLDYGKVNDECFSFLLCLGAVFESVHFVSPEDKTKFGMLAYVVNMFKGLFKSAAYHLRIEVDGNIYQGPVDHMIINMSNKFGQFKFTDISQDISDGIANVFILKNEGFFKKVSTLFHALWGRVEKNENIVYMQGSHIRVSQLKNKKEIKVDIDGDIGPCLPIDIRIPEDKVELYLSKYTKEENL